MKVILTILVMGLILYATHLLTKVDLGVYVSHKHWDVSCLEAVEEKTCEEAEPEVERASDVVILEKPTPEGLCRGNLKVVRYCAKYQLKRKAQE